MSVCVGVCRCGWVWVGEVHVPVYMLCEMGCTLIFKMEMTIERSKRKMSTNRNIRIRNVLCNIMIKCITPKGSPPPSNAHVSVGNYM